MMNTKQQTHSSPEGKMDPAAGKNLRPVPPNAARLIEALRHVGYDNYSALADLVDNSLDADARNIKVVLRQENKQPTIIVSDDGCGMDGETLLEAIKLGSMTDRSVERDLGRFGMGLSTATLSICWLTTVLTKAAGTPLVKAVIDIDLMIQDNDFVVKFPEPSAEDKGLFEALTGSKESGTVLMMRSIDHLGNTNLSVMADTLRGKFAEIYRYYLAGDRSIVINDKKVEPKDPLNPCPSPEPSKILLDEEIEVEFPDNNGGAQLKEKVRVKVAWLPNMSNESARREGLNIRTQGFYVMRNLRQIEGGSTLGGIFNKHPMLNRFRAELHLPAALDVLAEVNFRKSGYNLPQFLRDKIERLVGPHITFIRREFSKNITAKSLDAGDHDEAEREISKKARLLDLPAHKVKGEGGKRGPRQPGEGGGSRAGTAKERLDEVCKFENVDNGHGGQLYEVYPHDNGAIRIALNIAHPFYKRVIGPLREDPEARNCLDYLIFSMASAELKHSTDEESAELMTSFKATMSGNLRSLCI